MEVQQEAVDGAALADAAVDATSAIDEGWRKAKAITDLEDAAGDARAASTALLGTTLPRLLPMRTPTLLRTLLLLPSLPTLLLKPRVRLMLVFVRRFVWTLLPTRLVVVPLMTKSTLART